MKKIFILALVCISSLSYAQDIKLPAPSKKGGKTIMETFWARQSVREFSSKELSQQDLSDLLFAASGVSRPESGKITSPTALNKQEIDLYTFTKDAVYQYIPKTHTLKFITKGDYRNIIAAQQSFAKTAPVCLVMVANFDKFGRNDENAKMMCFADAGIMCENINLFCAARGLVTVPRASMNKEEIAKLLHLTKNQIPVLNNPVGYIK